MPDDKDSCVSSGDTSTHVHEEEEDSDNFFKGGEGAVSNRLSLSAASERSQSGGSTEDDPVGPVTLSAVLIMGSGTMSRKATTVDFSRTISSDSADLEDEEWVDPTPIPTMPLEMLPPAFPPPITKTKLSSSTKSRKRKELVVERKDGFIREEAVPCGCTQAT